MNLTTTSCRVAMLGLGRIAQLWGRLGSTWNITRGSPSERCSFLANLQSSTSTSNTGFDGCSQAATPSISSCHAILLPGMTGATTAGANLSLSAGQHVLFGQQYGHLAPTKQRPKCCHSGGQRYDCLTSQCQGAAAPHLQTAPATSQHTGPQH